MKLHLPLILRRSLLALIASFSLLPASAAVDRIVDSGFAPVGYYYTYGYDSKLDKVNFSANSGWKKTTAVTLYDELGNKVTEQTKYDKKYVEALQSSMLVEVKTNAETGRVSTSAHYLSAFLNQVDGDGGDYVRYCSDVDDLGNIINPGVWILSPSTSDAETDVLRMRNYGDIYISDSRQQYNYYTPVAITETGVQYEVSVKNYADETMVHMRHTNAGGGFAPTLSRIGFGLDVRDSDSFTYTRAYTAGTGSVSSGVHEYFFSNVKDIAFSDNRADGDGGLFYGQNWSFYVENSENVRFVGNSSGGKGTIGYASQSSPWSGGHQGGLQFFGISGEVLFEGNEGSCLGYNVCSQFVDVNKLTFSGNQCVLFRTYNSSLVVEMTRCNVVSVTGNIARDAEGLFVSLSNDNCSLVFTDCGDVSFRDNVYKGYLFSGDSNAVFNNVGNLSFCGNTSLNGTVVGHGLTVNGLTGVFSVSGNSATKLTPGSITYDRQNAAIFSSRSGGFPANVTVCGTEKNRAEAFLFDSNTAKGRYTEGLVSETITVEQVKQVSFSANQMLNESSESLPRMFATISVDEANKVNIDNNTMHNTGGIEYLANTVQVKNYDTFSFSGNSLVSEESSIRRLWRDLSVSNETGQAKTVTIADNLVKSAALTSGYAITCDISGAELVSFRNNVAIDTVEAPTSASALNGICSSAVNNTTYSGSYVALTQCEKVEFVGNELIHKGRGTGSSSSCGAALSGSVRLENIKTLAFSDNHAYATEVNGLASGGAAYVNTILGMSQIGSMTFASNIAGGQDGGFAMEARGGALYAFNDFKNGNEVGSLFFTENTARGQDKAYGGGAYFYKACNMSVSKELVFTDNVAVSGKTGDACGGALYLNLYKDSAQITSEGTIEFRRNASYGFSATGGALFCVGSDVALAAGQSLIVCDNTADAGESGSAAGGGVYAASSKSFTLSGGTMSFCGNGVRGLSAKGGAIYAKTCATLKDFDLLVMRGNYVQSGDTVVLNAIHMGNTGTSTAGNLSIFCNEGQRAEIYDSVNARSLLLNTSANNTGSILFSGTHTEKDLGALKANYTQEELAASRRIYSSSGISITYGNLQVRDGMQLVSGTTFKQAATAQLSLHNAGISAEGALTTSSVRFSGVNELSSSTSLAGTSWTLSLDATNKEQAVVTLTGTNDTGTITMGALTGLSLEFGEELTSGTYKLISFDTTKVSWNSLSKTALSGVCQSLTVGSGTDVRLLTEGNTQTLVFDYAVPVRSATTLTWGGGSGTWQLDDSAAWTGSVNDLSFHDGDSIIFHKGGDVTIIGDVAPASVIVTGSETLNLSGSGRLTGATALTKSGSGALAISTENTYSGGTTISGGTVTAGNAAAFGRGGITLSGGTLAMGTQAVANAVTATGGTLTGTAYKGNLTVKGNVTLGSGFKAGSLALESGTLTGTVKTGDVHTLEADGGRISGALTLNGGSIVFGGSPLSVSGALTISSSTTLDFSAYSVAGQYTLISAGSVSGNLGYLNYDSTVGRNDYSVVKSGNSLVLKVETAVPTLVWTAPRGVWSNNGGFGDAVFENGDLVQFGTQSNVTIKGPVNPGAVLVNADRNVVLTADRYTPGSGIEGSATLTKEGAGMLTLNAGNTYSGGTILKQGTLKAAADTAFGTGTITVKDGTLDLGGKAVTNNIVLAGNALLKGDAKYTGALSVQGQATLLGKMTNKATLTIGYGNTLTLAPTASVAGSIDVWNGTLNISSPRGLTVARGSFLALYDGTVNGGVSVGTGGVLVLHGGTMTTAPTLTGGVLVGSGGHTNVQLSGTGTLLLDSQYVCLKGKGTLISDSAPTVTGGKLTLQSLHDAYFDEINVDGGMLALGRVNTDMDIHVTGSAALNNGAFHSGDVKVDGELLKGSVIKLTNSKQSVDLNAAGVMNGTISGLGVVNVNDDINASLGKMTNAAVNLNSGTLTNIKGMRLVKGQTLTFGGGNLNLSGKLLTTAVGSTLNVSKSGTLDGNLTMAGGTLVLKNGATLTVNGALTLTKPTELVVNGTTTIKCNQFNGPRKGTLEEFFGVDKGVTITQKGNTLTFSGYTAVACAAPEEEPETVAAYVPVTDAAVALAAEAVAERPLGDALVMADWAIVDANRAFTGTLQSRRDSGVMLADGQGMAWVSAMGGVSRHGSENGHNGADVNLNGAAVGVEHTAGKNSTLGLAVGHTWSRIGATGMQHLRQDTAHVALYGQTKLPHGFTAEWSAAYGDTDSKGTFNGTRETWSQKSTAISARLNKTHELTDSTAVRGFAGLNYDATDAASIHGMHTGSIQRLQGEVGAGITHRADKLTTYAEASVTTDLARNAPAVDFGAWRQGGATPGRTSLNLTLGGAYELTDKWSINAAYHVEAAERATQHSFNVGAAMKF